MMADDEVDLHEVAKRYQQRAVRETEAIKNLFTETPSFMLVPTADDYPIFGVKTKVKKNWIRNKVTN